MKNTYLFLTVLAAGCVGVRVAPSAMEVQRVALVAVSMNTHFRDAADKDAATPGMEKRLPASERFVLEDTPALMEGLLEKSKASFFSALSGVRPWTVMPYEEMAAHPAFQEAMRSPGWVSSSQARSAAPGLLPTALADLSARVINLSGPRAPSVREKLSALARDLGVDAVVLVDLDMAYTLTGSVKWSVRQGRPDVGARLAAVTAAGDVAVKATPSTRFITDPVDMIILDGASLVQLGPEPRFQPEKTLKAFTTAVNSSAAMLAEDLSKKLAETR